MCKFSDSLWSMGPQLEFRTWDFFLSDTEGYLGLEDMKFEDNLITAEKGIFKIGTSDN